MIGEVEWAVGGVEATSNVLILDLDVAYTDVLCIFMYQLWKNNLLIQCVMLRVYEFAICCRIFVSKPLSSGTI